MEIIAKSPNVFSTQSVEKVITLKQLKPQEKGIVQSIANTGPIRRRLLDMGVTPGTEIIMRKTAPLGDPIEIHIRGYELSLRKAEAEQVIISRA